MSEVFIKRLTVASSCRITVTASALTAFARRREARRNETRSEFFGHTKRRDSPSGMATFTKWSSDPSPTLTGRRHGDTPCKSHKED